MDREKLGLRGIARDRFQISGLRQHQYSDRDLSGCRHNDMLDAMRYAMSGMEESGLIGYARDWWNNNMGLLDRLID